MSPDKQGKGKGGAAVPGEPVKAAEETGKADELSAPAEETVTPSVAEPPAEPDPVSVAKVEAKEPEKTVAPATAAAPVQKAFQDKTLAEVLKVDMRVRSSSTY